MEEPLPHNLFMIFMDLRRWRKSPRLTKSQSLSGPQEKSGARSVEDDLIDLAVHHEELTNEDLMDLEAQRRG